MRKGIYMGTCTYCKASVSRNKLSLLRHLEKCEGRVDFQKKEHTDNYIIRIQFKYDPRFFLIIKTLPNTTLRKLDKFLRDIWLECCGHLSDFYTGRSRVAKTRTLSLIMNQNAKLDYVYDFGSSTELTITMMDIIKMEKDAGIKILLRNRPFENECSFCGNSATLMCSYCAGDAEGYLCEDCREKHPCVEEEGDHVLRDICNSPRSGECGYTGPTVNIAKYFPKDIIE